VTRRVEVLGPDDIPGVAGVLTAIDRDTAQPRVVTADELLEEFDGVHTDPRRDVLGVRDGGDLIASAYTYLLRGRAVHRCYIMGGVHPDHRGHGAGRALLDAALDAATARLDTIDDTTPTVIRTYLPTVDPVLDAMFERRGFAAVRWFDDLHRPVADPPSAALAPGITITGWDATRSEELRAVKNAAFEDHWGSEPSTDHEWRQLTGGSHARPDLSRLALTDDGTIVGLLLAHRHAADDAVLGARYAWIDKVATLAEHRGRGIAAALIAASITAMGDAGIERVALGVDSANPTGAHELYRRLGFEPWTRYVTRERWVRPAPG
jgi:GNAT superfamily N-acetyltransferase